MPTITSPAQRLERMLSEGARLMALCPGQISIDITPDVMALLGEAKADPQPLDGARNLLEARDLGRDVATRVHFV